MHFYDETIGILWDGSNNMGIYGGFHNKGGTPKWMVYDGKSYEN